MSASTIIKKKRSLFLSCEPRFEWKNRLFPSEKEKAGLQLEILTKKDGKNGCTKNVSSYLEAALLTNTGRFYPIKMNFTKQEGGAIVPVIDILKWDVKDFGRWSENEHNSNKISLIDFASIPLKKQNQAGEEQIFIKEYVQSGRKIEKGKEK